MKKNPVIARHLAEANAAFLNYSGQASGGRKEELLGMNGMSSLRGGVPANGIKTITFDIQNTDETQPLSAVLFGANEGFVNPFNAGVDSITGNTAALKGQNVRKQF